MKNLSWLQRVVLLLGAIVCAVVAFTDTGRCESRLPGDVEISYAPVALRMLGVALVTMTLLIALLPLKRTPAEQAGARHLEGE